MRPRRFGNGLALRRDKDRGQANQPEIGDERQTQRLARIFDQRPGQQRAEREADEIEPGHHGRCSRAAYGRGEFGDPRRRSTRSDPHGEAADDPGDDEPSEALGNEEQGCA